MREALQAFRSAYRAAFTAHLTGADEAGLRAAYELGRTAMVRRLSVLDLAAIHHEVLLGALAATEDLERATTSASTFFLEVLATYEMVQRGADEAHQSARMEHQHAEQLRRLADASVAINAAGSIQEIAEVVPELAARVLETASATVAVGSGVGTGGEHVRSYPPDAHGDDGVSARLHAPLVRRNGSRLGRLEVVARTGATFTGKDQALLTQLAQVAGVALENAELYVAEQLVAETLQRKLLPRQLPTLSGVSMTWRYLPGWQDRDIGGDWYDALALEGDEVGFVVGDVMGKGVKAAAGMGQLRIALRAYAIEGHSPAAVIERLDQIVDDLEEDLATAVFLRLAPATGRLRYASAGHPPPLLIHADGSSDFLRGGLAPPLGCMLGADCTEDTVIVEAGATVLLYSDGLVERRGIDIQLGFDKLQDVVAGGDPSDLEAFCDHVLGGMDADRRGDDIALLAVRRDPSVGA